MNVPSISAIFWFINEINWCKKNFLQSITPLFQFVKNFHTLKSNLKGFLVLHIKDNPSLPLYLYMYLYLFAATV